MKHAKHDYIFIQNVKSDTSLMKQRFSHELNLMRKLTNVTIEAIVIETGLSTSTVERILNNGCYKFETAFLVLDYFNNLLYSSSYQTFPSYILLMAIWKTFSPEEQSHFLRIFSQKHNNLCETI